MAQKEINKAKEIQAEIERLLKEIPDRDLKTYQSVNMLLVRWMECESEIKSTQYPTCAPNWFYPYVNSL